MTEHFFTVCNASSAYIRHFLSTSSRSSKAISIWDKKLKTSDQRQSTRIVGWAKIVGLARLWRL